MNGLILLAVVMGGATYLWLAVWASLLFGEWVREATKSYGLSFGAYFVTGLGLLALPFAVVIS